MRFSARSATTAGAMCIPYSSVMCVPSNLTGMPSANAGHLSDAQNSGRVSMRTPPKAAAAFASAAPKRFQGSCTVVTHADGDARGE